jgi:hypothetical protein
MDDSAAEQAGLASAAAGIRRMRAGAGVRSNLPLPSASSRAPTNASALSMPVGGRSAGIADRWSRPPTLEQNGPGIDRASIGAPDDDYGLREYADDGFSSIDAFEARHSHKMSSAPAHQRGSRETGLDRDTAAAVESAASAFDSAWGEEVTVGDGFGDMDDDRAFTWGDTRVGPDANVANANATQGMELASAQAAESLRAKQAHENFVLQMQQQTMLQSQQMAAMMGLVPPAAASGSQPPAQLPSATATGPLTLASKSAASPRLISTDAADAKFLELARKLQEKDKEIGACSIPMRPSKYLSSYPLHRQTAISRSPRDHITCCHASAGYGGSPFDRRAHRSY